MLLRELLLILPLVVAVTVGQRSQPIDVEQWQWTGIPEAPRPKRQQPIPTNSLDLTNLELKTLNPGDVLKLSYIHAPETPKPAPVTELPPETEPTQPLLQPEPIRQPRPILQPEPIRQPEPILQPQPIPQAEITAQPEPILQPQPLPSGFRSASYHPVLSPRPLDYPVDRPLLTPRPKHQQPIPTNNLNLTNLELPSLNPGDVLKLSYIHAPETPKPAPVTELPPETKPTQRLLQPEPIRQPEPISQPEAVQSPGHSYVPPFLPVDYHTTPARTVATQPPPVFTERTPAAVLPPRPLYNPVDRPLLTPRPIWPAVPVAAPPQPPATAAPLIPVTEAAHIAPPIEAIQPQPVVEELTPARNPTENVDLTKGLPILNPGDVLKFSYIPAPETPKPASVTELPPETKPTQRLLQPEPIRQPEPISQPEAVQSPGHSYVPPFLPVDYHTTPARTVATQPPPVFTERTPAAVLPPRPLYNPVDRPLLTPRPIWPAVPVAAPPQPPATAAPLIPVTEAAHIALPIEAIQPQPVVEELTLARNPTENVDLTKGLPILNPGDVLKFTYIPAPETPKPASVTELPPETKPTQRLLQPEPIRQPEPISQPEAVQPPGHSYVPPFLPVDYHTTPTRTVATQPPPVFTERTHPEVLVTIPSHPPVTQAPGQLMFDFQCIEGNGYYYVQHECDTYVECKNNIAMKYACPDGLHFNPAAKPHEYPCAYPSEVKCRAGDVEQSPRATETCPSQYGFYSMNDGDCSKYIRCHEGIATIMDCPMGLAFNPQINDCDWPANVPQCNPNVFKDFKCPEPPNDEDGKISDIIYKYRYGQQCKLYIACQLGHPRLLSCDPGLAFDPTSESCIDEDYVTDCAVAY